MEKIYKELEKVLIEFAKKEENIEEYNPYTDLNLDNIIDRFYKSYEANDDDLLAREFSWYKNILGVNNLTKKYKNCANVHYGIPTHYHGDIYNGKLYTCLFNPRSEILTDDISTKDVNIGQYFAISSKLIVDKNHDLKMSYDHELINKNYDNKSIPYSEIKAYIRSDKALLVKELEDYNKNINSTTDKEHPTKLSDFYYLSKYFGPILRDKGYLKDEQGQEIKGWDREKINKIVNLELRIFRSRGKNALASKKQIVNDDFSTYSALIILYRLGKYLNNKKDKPIFVFRAFKDWELAFNVAFEKIYKKVGKLDKNNYSDYFAFLKENYFWGYPAQRATLSRNNLRTYKNKPEGDRISDEDYKYLLSLF